MNKEKKGFDCVEMKHRIQEEIYKETKNMSWEERRRKFERDIETNTLADLWRELHKRHTTQNKKAVNE